MRKIKFRGQRQSDNKWIYGDLLQPTELCNIYEISDCESLDGTRYDVIEQTIGQYTGLHDKNGKEIYEGDIFEIMDSYEEKFMAYIEYSEKYAQFVVKGGTAYYDNEPLGDLRTESIEIIGNIYENPELLEKE